MNAAMHPLLLVKDLLRGIVERGDQVRLRECLQGRYLPALGGGEEPAYVLHRALTFPPFDPRLQDPLGSLVAPLCTERADQMLSDLRNSEGVVAAVGGAVAAVVGQEQDRMLDDEAYVFNLLLFASLLPPNPELFSALLSFNEVGLRTGVLSRGAGRAARQLRQALIFQQTDDRLEPYWLGLIETPANGQGRLSADRRTDLMDAWHGLLWIPPLGEGSGTPVDLARVDRGLVGIYGACGDEIQAAPLLGYALRQLDEAYPASPEYWRATLAERLVRWPQVLQDLAEERWPRPTEGIEIPRDALDVWDALSVTERIGVNQLAEAGDGGAWKRFWAHMLFESPRRGIAPQQWCGALSQIEHVFEAEYPGLRGEEHRANIEALVEREATETPSAVSAVRRRGRGKGIDRLKALERVNQVMASIARQLRQGKEAAAAAYLRELVEAQQREGTEKEIIAKTLTNVATLARDEGRYQWADALYHEAQSLAPGDPVPLNGLAEVHRAQSRFDEAEASSTAKLSSVGRTTWWPATVWPRRCASAAIWGGPRGCIGRRSRVGRTTWWPATVWPRRCASAAIWGGPRGCIGRRSRVGRTTWWPAPVWPRRCASAAIWGGPRGCIGRRSRVGRTTWWPATVWPRRCASAAIWGGPRGCIGRRSRVGRTTWWPAPVWPRRGASAAIWGAEGLYRETVTRWPNNVVARNGLAETLRERGDLGGAEGLYRETVTRWPNDVVARTGLAETLRERGDLGGAEGLYRETVTRWPNDVVARNGLAETLRERGDLGGAEGLYRETVTRWPNNVVARNGLAETLRERGDLGGAQGLYRETVTRWPNDVVARTGLAETLRERGDLGEAEGLYRETVRRWPNNPVARHGLANTLRKRRQFQQALELVPEPDAVQGRRQRYDLHLRAMILLESGEVQRAAVLFRRALAERLPLRAEHVFRNALALTELKLRGYGAAADLADATPDDSPASNVIRLHAYAAAGRRQQARAVYAGLSAPGLNLPRRVGEPLMRIAAAYCVQEEDAECTPTDAEFDAILETEIDMLLAA